MDAAEFRRYGKDMVDYISDYFENIEDRLPFPGVKPGYMKPLIPDKAPVEGEPWEVIQEDIERVVMPGVTHWHSPQFFAYYPMAFSFPSLMGDMMSGALGCLGFSWKSSPAHTELEVNMMDWLAEMMTLPDEFKYSSGGKGGGSIQGSASEATLMSLLAARSKAVREAQKKDPSLTKGQILDKLVAYVSEQCHSSIDKACLIGFVNFKKLAIDENLELRGETLQKQINKDLKLGLIPFYLAGSIGTTDMCACDNLPELGPICNKHNIWFHVDAAYAGSACICPEFRHLLDGVEYADSFMFNPHKWLHISFECSTMWLKDTSLLSEAYRVDPLYLRSEGNEGNKSSMPDFRHWQVHTSRRMRSLKMWFVFRKFGVSGLQEHVRKQIGFASHFTNLLKTDSRFEIVGIQRLGLVCFRLKGPNCLSERLQEMFDEDRRIHIVPSRYRDMFFLRVVMGALVTEQRHIDYCWEVLQELTGKMDLSKVSELTNGHK